jgi:hypothetical protein
VRGPVTPALTSEDETDYVSEIKWRVLLIHENVQFPLLFFDESLCLGDAIAIGDIEGQASLMEV